MTRPDDARNDAAAEAVADLGRMLAHPRRVRVIGALMRGSGSSKTLAAALGAPLGSVYYHLARVLFKRFGVVELVEENRRRGARERVFALGASPAIRLLAIAVATYEAEASGASPRSAFGSTTLAVDGRGAREIDAAINRCSAVVSAVKKRCEELGSDDLTQLVVSAAAIEIAPLPEPEA